MLLASIAPAILDTVLGRLALLFLTGAGGDHAAARDAASQMLAAYDVQTTDELRLAAELIGFSFHALESLSQAAAPDLPLTKVLRLRGSAVSLSREGHKAQRKLDQLQRGRLAGATVLPTAVRAATPAAAPGAQPQIDNATELARKAAVAATSQNGIQGLQKCEAARSITDILKNKQREHENQLAALTRPTSDAGAAGFPGAAAGSGAIQFAV